MDSARWRSGFEVIAPLPIFANDNNNCESSYVTKSSPHNQIRWTARGGDGRGGGWPKKVTPHLFISLHVSIFILYIYHICIYIYVYINICIYISACLSLSDAVFLSISRSRFFALSFSLSQSRTPHPPTNVPSDWRVRPQFVTEAIVTKKKANLSLKRKPLKRPQGTLLNRNSVFFPRFVPADDHVTPDIRTRSESKYAFSAVLSTEGRVVGLCWEHLKPKRPKGLTVPRSLFSGWGVPHEVVKANRFIDQLLDYCPQNTPKVIGHVTAF